MDPKIPLGQLETQLGEWYWNELPRRCPPFTSTPQRVETDSVSLFTLADELWAASLEPSGQGSQSDAAAAPHRAVGARARVRARACVHVPRRGCRTRLPVPETARPLSSCRTTGRSPRARGHPPWRAVHRSFFYQPNPSEQCCRAGIHCTSGVHDTTHHRTRPAGTRAPRQQ